jgi:hypothetical protein
VQSLFLDQIDPVLTMLHRVDYLSDRGHFEFRCIRPEGDGLSSFDGDPKDRAAVPVDLLLNSVSPGAIVKSFVLSFRTPPIRFPSTITR